MVANTPASTWTDPSPVSVRRDMCSAVMGRPVPVSVLRSGDKRDFARAICGGVHCPTGSVRSSVPGVLLARVIVWKGLSLNDMSPCVARPPPAFLFQLPEMAVPIFSLPRGHFEARQSPIS